MDLQEEDEDDHVEQHAWLDGHSAIKFLAAGGAAGAGLTESLGSVLPFD
jgi:solute carrier family 25 phosphate transporter 23/24/25/41